MSSNTSIHEHLKKTPDEVHGCSAERTGKGVKGRIEHRVLPLATLVPEKERAQIWHIIDHKTKPPGALGVLEPLAALLVSCAFARAHAVNAKSTEEATIQTRPAGNFLNAPQVLIFGGDHGIAAEGVSIASSEVTAQMVETIVSGGASVSVCAAQADIPLEVVDCGILHIGTISESTGKQLIDCRLGNITGAIHRDDAMSLEQACQGLENGRSLAHRRCLAGMDLLCVGEIGIGNTSAAAALMAELTGLDIGQCVGRGTGVSEAALQYKKQLLEAALARIGSSREQHPLKIAAHIGGFELVTMAGAMIGAAEHQVPIVIDGFVSSVCALLACTLVPEVRDYLIFSHQSDEQGHALLLEWLKARPLMTLGLRIGEGTGAVLAVPLLRSSLACYNDMASFTQAGISL
ncbi:Nicotinate-nucleotide--dimethylbenzimidazole phosphoribosyltransferase [Halomonadaceae bacterium LMG 33818]|uniref:nicotinate-nucleotide--dimethylbenzimidazole phosphoribosyltransferase n=1 Tax=Cernens ardua TaxID=3402176 RepID=UPI003EDC1E01